MVSIFSMHDLCSLCKSSSFFFYSKHKNYYFSSSYFYFAAAAAKHTNYFLFGVTWFGLSVFLYVLRLTDWHYGCLSNVYKLSAIFFFSLVCGISILRRKNNHHLANSMNFCCLCYCWLAIECVK